MRRRAIQPKRLRWGLGVATAVTWALVAGFASAAVPEAPHAAAHPGEWKGRFCTASGCTGATETRPWAHAAAFGAAVVATGVLARRSSALSGSR